jgi:hypothetical protein
LANSERSLEENTSVSIFFVKALWGTSFCPAGILLFLCHFTFMDENKILAMAIGVAEPWMISKIQLDNVKGHLDVFADFEESAAFPCPKCGKKDCRVYDTEETVWDHLRFFQNTTSLHARRPRVECSDCGINSVVVPWEKAESAFN